MRYKLERVEERLEQYEIDIEDSEAEVTEGDLRAFRDFGLSLEAQQIIADCQLIIEVCIKAMFKLVGVTPREEHVFDFQDDRVKAFMNAVPDEFYRNEDIPRAIKVMETWYGYYEDAKYGRPQANIPPVDLLGTADVDHAVEDARFVFNLAEALRRQVCD